MSDYRDDREALRARNAALEDELAAKEAELARLRARPAVSAEALTGRPAVTSSPRPAIGISPNFAATAGLHEDMFAPNLTRPAWVGCSVLGLVYVADIAAGRFWRGAGGPATDSSVVWMALVGTAILALIVIALCGRLLSRLPGVGADFMVGRVYLPWLFGLFFPIHPLIEGLIRIGSTQAGGYTSGGGDTAQRYQPVVMMKHGEGRPLGVALLMNALLWPLAVLSLASPWIHPL